MNVSTKTIQRWVNGSTKFIPSDDLRRLAQFLEVETSQLTQEDVILTERTLDPILKQILENIQHHQPRASGTWRRYSKMLLHFRDQILDSKQEALLYYYLGTSALRSSKSKAAARYLARACTIATQLEDHDLQILILCRISELDLELLDANTALEKISSAEALLHRASSSTQAHYYFISAQIAHKNGDTSGALGYFRKSLIQFYRDKEVNLKWVTECYLHLAEIHESNGDSRKAKVCLLRAIKKSVQSDWMDGLTQAYRSLEKIAPDSSRLRWFKISTRSMTKPKRPKAAD